MRYLAALTWVILSCISIAADAQGLLIYHIDVDQADATLFVTPSGSTLLVDAGRSGSAARIKALLVELASIELITSLLRTTTRITTAESMS